MRHLNKSWQIMNDPRESRHFRSDSEAEVREHASVGMFPDGKLTKAVVLAACERVRSELGIEIGPQPIRFTDKELRFLIAAVENIEFGEREEMLGVINKLRHREKTMRNSRNQARRGRQLT
jgi:hypothetical protein